MENGKQLITILMGNVMSVLICLNLTTLDFAALLQETLKTRTGQGTVPNVFINGRHIGGCDSTFKIYEQNKLLPLVHGANSTNDANTPMDIEHNFDYDL